MYESNPVNMSHVKKEVKTYHFHSQWEVEYFFVDSNGKCVCSVCNRSVSLPKKANVERHFKSTHNADGKFDELYPPNSTLRKEYLKKLKVELKGQQDVYTKATSLNEAATEASEHVARIIAKHKKPYSDGEIMKQALKEVADKS